MGSPRSVVLSSFKKRDLRQKWQKVNVCFVLMQVQECSFRIWEPFRYLSDIFRADPGSPGLRTSPSSPASAQSAQPASQPHVLLGSALRAPAFHLRAPGAACFHHGPVLHGAPEYMLVGSRLQGPCSRPLGDLGQQNIGLVCESEKTGSGSALGLLRGTRCAWELAWGGPEPPTSTVPRLYVTASQDMISTSVETGLSRGQRWRGWSAGVRGWRWEPREGSVVWGPGGQLVEGACGGSLARGPVEKAQATELSREGGSPWGLTPE